MDFPHASEAFKKLNPHVFPVAGLRSKESKPDKRREGEDSRMEEGKAGVHYLVTITVYRRRLLDNHDNARSACKPICDLITLCLRFKSDDCPALTWEYHQVVTKGATGTHIIISRTSPCEQQSKQT